MVLGSSYCYWTLSICDRSAQCGYTKHKAKRNRCRGLMQAAHSHAPIPFRPAYCASRLPRCLKIDDQLDSSSSSSQAQSQAQLSSLLSLGRSGLELRDIAIITIIVIRVFLLDDLTHTLTGRRLGSTRNALTLSRRTVIDDALGTSNGFRSHLFVRQVAFLTFLLDFAIAPDSGLRGDGSLGDSAACSLL